MNAPGDGAPAWRPPPDRGPATLEAVYVAGVERNLAQRVGLSRTRLGRLLAGGPPSRGADRAAMLKDFNRRIAAAVARARQPEQPAGGRHE